MNWVIKSAKFYGSRVAPVTGDYGEAIIEDKSDGSNVQTKVRRWGYDSTSYTDFNHFKSIALNELNALIAYWNDEKEVTTL